MPFCCNCGYKISEEAKFCPQCGQKAVHAAKPEPVSPPEEAIPVPLAKPVKHKQDKTFTLLNAGDVFQEHYKVKKIIGRDDDGISYLVADERCGAQRSLKLYHQSYFDNVDKLFGSIVRMSKIKHITHPGIAKAFEVNQSHRPAYIVSEYVEGKSLASIKELNPELLTESLSRNITIQIVEAAIAIRKAGLSVFNLNLNNIILTEEQDVIILSSGISYDVGDEREDIFNLGLQLAKLFSTSAFYNTLYFPQRIMEKRFDFIPGVTKQMNEILERCLQKNLNQRYDSFEHLLKALNKLKPIRQQDIHIAEETAIHPLTDDDKMALPSRKLDTWFWIAIVITIVFIAVLMSTNLLETVFGQDETTFKFTGFLTEINDTVNIVSSQPDDSYRRIRTNPPAARLRSLDESEDRFPAQTEVTPRVEIPASDPLGNRTPYRQDTSPAQTTTPTTTKPVMPAGFVYLKASTFAYGNLKADAKADVSLSSFYISSKEVTQAEWNRYMSPANVSLEGDNYPVDNVTWYEAVQYCNLRSEAEGLTPAYKISGINVSCNFRANGYRLPTEAEWEYAARADKAFKYSGSNTAHQVAWYKNNAQGRMHPVKTKSANAFGLYDLTGNVSE
ncbi:MAG: SUMF1/EgtB/PvdO family nonheme iron enzyme, partial [Candidatus Cloacimonadaceae bacterium]